MMDSDVGRSPSLAIVERRTPNHHRSDLFTYDYVVNLRDSIGDSHKMYSSTFSQSITCSICWKCIEFRRVSLKQSLVFE
jgi:hypothetical protein